MRGVLYIVIVALLFFAPVHRVNVAQLLPIRGVAMYLDEEKLVLETDTGHKGRGSGVEEALLDLKEGTPAVVYLDTAQYLLVAEAAKTHVEKLRPHLKGSVRVAVCNAADNVSVTIDYLSVHADLPKLRSWPSPAEEASTPS